ncbi:hypothetical protein [Aquabacterium humicola]|uniref:hypothetical protein n=1 Tax=Aquabacterium humicola TaxID=3237377 RepID=UPI002543455C|nr:hypothetical protein [Rubrivivax pictus]
MRAAPPAVDIELGCGRRERAAAAALYGLAGAVIAVWLCLLLERNPVLPAFAAALAGLAVGAKILRPVCGHLRWDGAAWTLAQPGHTPLALRRVRLQIDLGGWLLLRIEPIGPARPGWCGIAQKDIGAAWHGVRLALYQGPMDADTLALDDGATR